MPCVAGLVSNDSYSLNRVERQLQAPATASFATCSRCQPLPLKQAIVEVGGVHIWCFRAD